MAPLPEAYLQSARRLVGRKSELATVLAAISDPTGASSFILFEGQGGIGKTRLLSEARERCYDRAATLCTEVIDLYLTRYHGQARLMFAIAAQLQQDADRRGLTGVLFGGFLSALDSFYSSMGEGSEDQRRQLEQTFLEEYGALAASYRLVLLIDTLEKLHPTIPDAEEFDFREVGRLERWLARLLGHLPNTVVLLAGRPRARQRQLFADALDPALTLLSIQPFTAAETAAYITSEFAELTELDQERIAVLHRMSAGRPVVLAIALACAQHDLIDIAALPVELAQAYPENRASLSDAFVQLIIGDLYYRRPDMAQLLARAVYLRKGLRAALLAQILASEGDDQDPGAVAVQLERFAELVFVKPIGEHEIILHDEMYELLLYKIGDQQAAAWWRVAISYLDQEIAQTTAQLQSVAYGAMSAPRISYASLQQKLQTLQVERMFYQMSLDPRRGYQNYRELSSNAIAARDEDFDAQLQEELARFFDPETKWGQLYQRRLLTSDLTWNRIVYDDGIRWVYRRINAHIPGRDRYLDAIRIAERVRVRYGTIYEQEVLARCDLDAAQLQAEVYISEKAPRGAQIAQNFQVLRAALLTTIAALPADAPEGAYARFILANAYNYWGYFERIHDRLESAAEKYTEAILLYRQLGPEVDSLHAVTLNNLGYALARQGDSERGLISLERSLAMVSRIGAVYRVATTLNTQAHLFTDLGQTDRALSCVLEARRLFNQFDSIRALALNANAEGRIRSRIAESLADPAQRDAEYERAAAAYREAINAFDAEGELTRRIEVRASLARTLRDWARDRTARGKSAAARTESLSLLAAARALTTEKTPQVLRCSLLEVIGSVLVDQGNYAEALRLLAEARALLPTNLRDATGFGESPETRELRIYWLRYGQIELQDALAAFGLGRYEDGCASLVRAFTGLISFSPETAPIARFRELARHALLATNDAALISALRAPTEAAAVRMGAPTGAAAIVDRLLDQVAQSIKDRDLFGS